MSRMLLIALTLTGCVAQSQIGPYVKHVERNGDWLVIHKCMIVLDGDELTEQQCTFEQIPLQSIPQGGPPPVSGPPSQPMAPPQQPPR